MKTITLYRPIGEKELILIAQNNFTAFPPRLEWQPIFYPVLNEAYATEIASKWNITDAFGNYLGFVTEFKINEEEFLKYKVENVGGRIHNELWIPAESLDNFNKNIIGNIKIIKVCIGEKFEKASNAMVQTQIERLKNENEKL